MNPPNKKAAATLPLVRCAIYTRKSTEEGLEQEFNSLDAQRESAEAFIRSQTHEGWTCLPERYDDGGFTGGNMERPALQRLLADIRAGKVDCVVTYKVDRLSRSLLDFAKMMETFEQHGVSFVSITQQFNSATSMAAPPASPPGYELRDEIGHGGLGVVYRARDTDTPMDRHRGGLGPGVPGRLLAPTRGHFPLGGTGVAGAGSNWIKAFASL
jgi:site-specific DNA recombinase